MTSPLRFHLFQPKGKLAPYIQGIWAASLPAMEPMAIKRTLLADARSGITFLLEGEVIFAGNNYSSGTIFSPTSKQAKTITILPGARLAGFRFHTCTGFGLPGEHLAQATVIEDFTDFPLALDEVNAQLQLAAGQYQQLSILYKWLGNKVDHIRSRPESLSVTLDKINACVSMTQLVEQLTVGQRQLERLFKQWAGVTPKHYQRIWRVKNTLEYLKHNTRVNLAELAIEQGFTDQAHMQREIKQIAQITPKTFVKRYL